MRRLAAASTLILLVACSPEPSSAPGGTETQTPVTADVAAPAPSTEAPPSETEPPAAGPSTTPAASAPAGEASARDWREVVSAADTANLRRLDQAWRLSLAEARDKGFGDEVRALGALADPEAGQAGRLQPAPGNYRCRTINLGSQSGDGLAFVAYAYFRCRVELTPGGDLILSKTTGSQRVRGLLYPDSDRRLVFAGAQAWGMDETGYPDYGDRPERDQVGVFERIGAERWRLVIPWPRVDSNIEILELVR